MDLTFVFQAEIPNQPMPAGRDVAKYNANRPAVGDLIHIQELHPTEEPTGRLFYMRVLDTPYNSVEEARTDLLNSWDEIDAERTAEAGETVYTTKRFTLWALNVPALPQGTKWGTRSWNAIRGDIKNQDTQETK